MRCVVPVVTQRQGLTELHEVAWALGHVATPGLALSPSSRRIVCVDTRHEVGDAHVIALPRGSVGEEPVQPAHGLRGLEVRESRHDNIHLLLRALHGNRDESAEVPG